MHRSPSLTIRALALVGLVTALTAASPTQKLNPRYRQFPALGLEVRLIADMSDVPVDDGMRSLGIIAQGQAERGPQVKSDTGERSTYEPHFYVFFDEPVGPKTGEGAEDDPGRRRTPLAPKDRIRTIFQGGLDLGEAVVAAEPFKSAKKIEGQIDRFVGPLRTNIGKVELVFDVYTFYIDQAKLIFLWEYPADDKVRKKWEAEIGKSMKSLRPMKSGESDIDIDDVDSESSYEDLLAYHQHEVEQTPGWKLVEVPTKQYLIKTNYDDKGEIKEVIERLEASRRLFEEDFPPAAPITSVSVVRICATREEFNTYGQTGDGVAGYFNPRSEELVLFFGDGSLKETMGVMTHEAFHQYCHFLFNRSEAHRWFDEGHGDYYGAWTMKGRDLQHAPDMKGGLSRIPHLKELHREGKLAPLGKHIRADHGTWQNQGPKNISNYCQSFALVTYLRQGARGKIKRKYWRDEYAEIVPNYMASLAAGYQAAYDKIIKEAEERLAEIEAAQAAGEDVPKSVIKSWEDAKLRPWDVFTDPAERQAIWDKAMADSWGKIDEAELERLWLDYIDKEM